MESLLTIPPKAKKADRSGPFQSHIKILVKSLRPLEHDGQKSVQIISRVASRSEIVIPLLSLRETLSILRFRSCAAHRTQNTGDWIDVARRSLPLASASRNLTASR